MLKLVIGMRSNQGFTLIEIMVVLVIIGITFGFALISFGDFGENKQIIFAAEQLVNTMKLAQQQSILDNSTLGLNINPTGYQVVFLQDKRWSSSNQGFFKFNYFPSKTQIHLKRSNLASSNTPSIIFNAAGEMTSFVLYFNNAKENIVFITGAQNGEIKMQLAGSS